MIELGGIVTGYAAGIGILSHSVARSNEDLKSLIANVSTILGPSILNNDIHLMLYELDGSHLLLLYSFISNLYQSEELESGSNSNGNIPTDKPYPKLSKATSGYLEIEHFKHADLHTGYFCYNCTYFIKDTHCAIVDDSGPDVDGKESGVITPYGVCTLWHPNEQETK